MTSFKMCIVSVLLAAPVVSNAGFVTLYDQDFEAPSNFINGFGSGYDDLSQQLVNNLYGNQPVGFTFAQSFTVETALLTGNEAFGSGYIDTSGKGGNYAIGMLSGVQNDLLGLSFNVGAFDFFNLSVDVSGLGLSGGPGSPFNFGESPLFNFTLYDNPTGANTTGSGAVLDTAQLGGTASPNNVLDWTNGVFSFDTSNSTNGNVALQIDLLQGGYAVLDNIKITASDEAGGGISDVPEPSILALMATGLAGIGFARRRKQQA